MARARDPNRDIAKQLYLDSNGEMLLKDIAEQLGKGEGTVRGWKNKDSWDSELNGTLQSDERNAPLKNTERSVNEKCSKSAVSSQSNERKRSGNPKPSYSFPKHNKAAEIHGFHSKVMPPEIMELFEEVEDMISTGEMLWQQIKLQYLAIMRAQSIMFVKSKDEMVKEIKKERFELMEDGPERIEVEYELQFAWDRHAQFLNAQSRSISELRNLIDQFDKITDEADSRHLKLKQMRLDIDKKNIDIDKSKTDLALKKMELEREKREQPVGSEANKYAYMSPEERAAAIARLKEMKGQ